MRRGGASITAGGTRSAGPLPAAVTRYRRFRRRAPSILDIATSARISAKAVAAHTAAAYPMTGGTASPIHLANIFFDGAAASGSTN